ncbi:MAG: DUF3014 domain-containing protein [Desulfobulbaceae bacterium]|nr:DUF3014 domain-containing protein [Desulfobulbaceae bacterium]
MKENEISWLIPLLLAAGVAGALWYFWAKTDQPTVDPTPAMTAPAPEKVERRLGPLHPIEPFDESSTGEHNLVPLPSLDDSDGYLRLELVNIFGRKLDELLTDETLVEKFVATVDNLPRSHVAERLRPLGRLSGAFVANTEDGGDTFFMGVENYARYEYLVRMVEAVDLNNLVETYRRYYPLFQEAYIGLGYPSGYFNDRVVEVIDHLLAAPTVDEPVQLARPHVLYEYSNAELEALSSGQKFMLRMGNENAERLKQTLRDVRSRIAP